MSRISKLVFIPLAAGWFLSDTGAEVNAQNAGRKKSPVVPAQAKDRETNAPRPKPLPRRSEPADEVDDDADQPAARPPSRPRAEAMRVPKLDPKLEKILVDWEQHSAGIEKLTGTFERHRYDYTFEVDFVADGRFAYLSPDKGAYEFEGREPPKGAVGKKKNAKGVPFTMKADKQERWVCTGTEVLRIDEKEKTYEKVAIPPENQGERIIDGPLPFLFGMKAEQAKRRYSFELLDPKPGALENAIWLKVTPKWAQDAMNWSEAYVIIDPATFLPRAVRLIEPSGAAETVHYFKDDLVVNARANPFNIFKSDPFKPNLKSYKLVLAAKDGENAPPRAAGIDTRPSGPGAPPARRPTAEQPSRNPQRSADSSTGGAKRQVKRVAR